MTSYSRTERTALCDLLAELGPDAPTLCTGWSTRDLAAHLVVRERHPLAAAGIVLPPLSGLTTQAMRALAGTRTFDALVGLLRQGPPAWSPVRHLRRLDEGTNAVEFFVHHEDVRRAQPGWRPRDLPQRQQEDLWRRLARSGRLMLRHAPVGVALERADGSRVSARRGSPTVTVVGEPAELLLFVFGRKDAARVELRGDPDAVSAVRGTALGV